MNYLKIIIFNLLLAFAGTKPFMIRAMEDASFPRDEVDFDFCDNPEVSQIINDTQWAIDTQCSKADVVTTLVAAKIVPLLEQNFFLRSNNINSRSLLDYPEFLPFRHDADKKGLVLSLFYNQTARGYFTRSSTNICSYLAIAQPTFLAAVDKVITAIGNLIELPVDKSLLFDLLDLFLPSLSKNVVWD